MRKSAERFQNIGALLKLFLLLRADVVRRHQRRHPRRLRRDVIRDVDARRRRHQLHHLQVHLGTGKVLGVGVGLALLHLDDRPLDLPDDFLPIFSDRIPDEGFGQVVELRQTAFEANVEASLAYEQRLLRDKPELLLDHTSLSLLLITTMSINFSNIKIHLKNLGTV